MRTIIIILFLGLLGLSAQSQSFDKNRLGFMIRSGMGINSFSDIKWDKSSYATANHFRGTLILGLHYSRFLSSKFYVGAQGGVGFYKKYKQQQTKYEEYSYPFEIHGGFEVFKIKSVAFDLRGVGGVQRFVQYYKHDTDLSNKKRSETKMGYGFGFGFNFGGEPNSFWQRSKSFLMYHDYGTYKFYSFTTVFGINL